MKILFYFDYFDRPCEYNWSLGGKR